MRTAYNRIEVIILGVVLAALMSVAATAGTLVFPPPDGTTTCQNYDVPNTCAIVSFNGGSFMTSGGANVYRGGDNFASCQTPLVSWHFVGAFATEANIKITNNVTQSEPPDPRSPNKQNLRIRVTDYTDGVNPITTTSTKSFPEGQSVTVALTGTAIEAVSVAVVDASNGLECWGGTSSPCGSSWTVTSMSAQQPINPTLDLSLRRNGDGTFSAVLDYTFPPQSKAEDRVLSLSMLAAGKESGTTYFTMSNLAQSGTIVQPLGAIDTDRTLQATAYACDGYAGKQATVSGCSKCKGLKTAVGGPVRLFDGVMTYSEADPLPATMGVEFRREYSSGAASDGRFGLGWSSIFDASALSTSTDNKSVAVVLEDRTRAMFRLASTGQWVQEWPVGGVSGTLTGDEITGYTFRDGSGSIVRTFDATHHMVRVQDLRSNRAVSITYDAAGNPARVFDERGNWSCTITSANQHIVGISVDGRADLAWTYAYSGSLLTSVTVAGAPAAWRTYDYGGNHLSAIHDASGAIIERHDYDALGRATSSYDASGDISTIQYPASDANGLATTLVTRADNSQETFEQGFSAGAVVTRRADGGCASCGTSDATAAYDSNGNLVGLQDARGYITQSLYDASGHHLISTTVAMTPSGCDPMTDSGRCRLSSDALAAASLSQTSASETINYTYGDLNWPAKPTQTSRNGVLSSAVIETFTFDATTGETLVHTMTGAVNSAGTQESHSTTTLLYGAGEVAAFNPGGAFQSTWLSLPQPTGLRKSIDGPRTDVSDVTRFVYYPLDSSVPATWRGRIAAVQDALGHISRSQDYDVFGNAATRIDANGVITRFTFDAMGRMLTSTIAGVAGCNTSVDPLCATDLTTSRTYAMGSGALATEQRPAGNVSNYTYDMRGRLQTLTRGTDTTLLERIDYTYDPTSGKKSSEVFAAFQNNSWVTTKTDTYSYTSDGHLSNVVHADGTKQVYAYLPDGTLSSVQDENHTAPNSVYSYDPANRVSSVSQTLTGATGGQVVTRYGYDLRGNLTSVIDPNGNTTTYLFDDFGRMLRQSSPVSGMTTYTYDAAGNLLTTMDANGATTTRTYDALNRALSSIHSSGTATETLTWSYDDATVGNFALGRLASLTDPTGATTYQYDRRGQLRSEVKTIGASSYTTTFAYDGNGNRSTMTYPNGLLARTTFDFADRPYSMTANGASIVSSATYLPFGPMSSLVLGNGTTRTVQYDNRYRPLENKVTKGAATIADYTYANDNVGNITQIHDATDARYNRDFGYDDLNRLTTANSGTSLWGAGSFSYDAMGNMLSSTLGTWKSTSSSLVGTTPKLSSVIENGASRPVTYDAAGNEVTVGSSAYAYNPRNQLVSADAATYLYDGRGLMTAATISVLAANIAPSTVTGGTAATATVTLSTPATADTTVTLSTNNPSAATVPSSVIVRAGQTSASFTETTMPVSIGSGVTITASYKQYSASNLLYVFPPVLTSLSISPTTVAAGGAATGTVTLNGLAASNLSVALSSDNTAATIPASITIPAGSSSTTFPISTRTGVANATATISATLDGNTQRATLLIGPAELSSIAVTPASVINGRTFNGTVTLTSAATSTMTIFLTATDSQVSLPGQITIPSGSTTGTFTIYTYLNGNGSVTETIAATHGTVRVQTTITVLPPSLTTFSVLPGTFVGGTVPLSGSAGLTGNAPQTGWQLPIGSTNTTTVPVPSPVTINSGMTSGQGMILTRPVLSATSVTLSASDPLGTTRSTTVTVQPSALTLSTLTLSASSILASGSVTGTVTLTAVAPTGGVDVDLKTDNNGFSSLPPYVRVPAGAKTATFTVSTPICYIVTPNGTTTCSNVTVNISATHSATTKTAALAVTQPTSKSGPFILPVANPPAVITAGSTASVTLSLNIPSASAGTAITLSSSNTAAATVPSSITIASKAQSQTFTVTTLNLAAAAPVTITASCKNNVQKFTVTVAPSTVPTLASLTLAGPQSFTQYYSTSPFMVSGNGYLCTVALTAPAPVGGAVVAIGGSRDNIVTVPWNPLNVTPAPNSITIPAGSTSASDFINVEPFLGTDRGTIITATYKGITLSQVVSVWAKAASLERHDGVQCAALSVVPCLSAMPRAAEATGDTSGYYLYTPEMQLLAETEVSSNTTKSIAYSYLWFAGQPIASVEQATNTTRWYATDHLGTPVIQTDTSGAVVWRAEYAPYGAIFSYRAGATLHQPLRFPGQIAQDGTDSYYNVFRWYRAGWGRYTQVDPFIATVRSPYAYVDGRPLVASDDLGLFKWLWSPAAQQSPAPASDCEHASGRAGSDYVLTKVACTLIKSVSLACRCQKGIDGQCTPSITAFFETEMHILLPSMIRPGMAADPSVIDFDSAVNHEVNKHLTVAGDRLRNWLQAKETPQTQSACNATCASIQTEANNNLAFAIARQGMKESRVNQ